MISPICVLFHDFLNFAYFWMICYILSTTEEFHPHGLILCEPLIHLSVWTIFDIHRKSVAFLMNGLLHDSPSSFQLGNSSCRLDTHGNRCQSDFSYETWNTSYAQFSNKSCKIYPFCQLGQAPLFSKFLPNSFPRPQSFAVCTVLSDHGVKMKINKFSREVHTFTFTLACNVDANSNPFVNMIKKLLLTSELFIEKNGM